MSDEEDFEYDYSDDDGYPVENNSDEDDQSKEEDMEWASTPLDDDVDNPNTAPIVVHTYEPKVPAIRMLPSEELVTEMKRRLKDVVEILDIPYSAAAVLLREFNWSKENLLERLYMDPDKLLNKCGVKARCQPKQTTTTTTKKGDCDICYEDNVTLFAMPCGHEFCKPCWNEFCAVSVSTGPACVETTCPDASCLEKVTEEEFEHTATPQLLEKFLNFQLRSFLDSNALTRWCPGRGCEMVACASSASALETQNTTHCDACDTSFCLLCGEEPHAPSSCKELARWMEKCKNESETANWILANTKPCPKCSSRIEKNQGCNHMTCQRCKYEFCWICVGSWIDHGANTGGYYKCNKYETNTGGGNDQSDAAKAKRELDRYLHYYKRYHAHAEAQTFAKKQLRETEARMVLLQESTDNAKWSDVEFLKTANEQLMECRRVLKYTYTFAYYLTDETKMMQKERFEHHQEMLEKFTENLSELSEKPLAEMDRTDVVNQTRVVGRFLKNILKYVEDDMEDHIELGV